MDAPQLLAKFWQIFGEEKAKKFVFTLLQRSRTQGRLLFWQEKMLQEFYQQMDMAELDFATVLKVFNYCPVHKVDLLQDTVSIEYGTRKPDSAEALERAQNLYPFANTKAYGPCWVESKTETQVWYCPICRTALNNTHINRT